MKGIQIRLVVLVILFDCWCCDCWEPCKGEMVNVRGSTLGGYDWWDKLTVWVCGPNLCCVRMGTKSIWQALLQDILHWSLENCLYLCINDCRVLHFSNGHSFMRPFVWSLWSPLFWTHFTLFPYFLVKLVAKVRDTGGISSNLLWPTVNEACLNLGNLFLVHWS